MSKFQPKAQLGTAEKVGAAVGAVIAVLLLLALVMTPSAWVLMLVLGGLHSVAPAIPAIGFWLTYGVLYALAFAIGTVRSLVK